MEAAWHVLVVAPGIDLAARFLQDTPATPDPDRVTPGLAGFLVVFFLALATVMLVRSMTRHLRKVRFSPDPAAADEPQPQPPEPPARSGPPQP